jgi:hypothetical protein
MVTVLATVIVTMMTFVFDLYYILMTATCAATVLLSRRGLRFAPSEASAAAAAMGLLQICTLSTLIV